MAPWNRQYAEQAEEEFISNLSRVMDDERVDRRLMTGAASRNELLAEIDSAASIRRAERLGPGWKLEVEWSSKVGSPSAATWNYS